MNLLTLGLSVLEGYTIDANEVARAASFAPWMIFAALDLCSCTSVAGVAKLGFSAGRTLLVYGYFGRHVDFLCSCLPMALYIG